VKNRSWINGSTYVRKVDYDCIVVFGLGLGLLTLVMFGNSRNTIEREDKDSRRREQKRGGRTRGVGGEAQEIVKGFVWVWVWVWFGFGFGFETSRSFFGLCFVTYQGWIKFGEFAKFNKV
jgi:hypothetical protein